MEVLGPHTLWSLYLVCGPIEMRLIPMQCVTVPLITTICTTRLKFVLNPPPHVLELLCAEV